MELPNGSTRTAASLSARRAWIEIDHQGQDGKQLRVALRKESVDRNRFKRKVEQIRVCRSPQGERG